VTISEPEVFKKVVDAMVERRAEIQLKHLLQALLHLNNASFCHKGLADFANSTLLVLQGGNVPVGKLRTLTKKYKVLEKKEFKLLEDGRGDPEFYRKKIEREGRQDLLEKDPELRAKLMLDEDGETAGLLESGEPAQKPGLTIIPDC